jgi:hypothetical protein
MTEDEVLDHDREHQLKPLTAHLKSWGLLI